MNIFTKINNPITIPKYVTLFNDKNMLNYIPSFKKKPNTYSLKAEKKESPVSSSSSIVEVMFVRKFKSN